MRKKRIKMTMSLDEKLRYIVLCMLFPLIIMIAALVFLLGYYSVRYYKIAHNVMVSSEFSIDFKENMDLDMYYFTVGSKYQKELPIEEVETAIGLAQSLLETTYQKESQKTIQNILDYCLNLKDKMHDLEATTQYDSRMRQLDNNIYVLTDLIQGKINDYIYYEAGYMAQIEEKMIQDIKVVICFAVVLVTAITTIILRRSLQFTHGITKPIGALCENVRSVGHGTFIIPEIETSDYEIRELNDGIQKMAKRIAALVENVKQEEKLQHKTQLQLLQSQVNPHFLYNTLDTIMWLVESGMNTDAVKMLNDLSIFFRTSLSKGADVICLEDEIMHTRSYLEIQQARYRDILDYEIDLPEELKHIKLPKLTLQPLAENAIYHGVKEKRGKSTISISCRRSDRGEIQLSVRDNGIGMKAERFEQITQALKNGVHEGFGLAAVNDRIRLYFGSTYGIHIWSEYTKGTCVTVTLSENIELI